MTKIIALLILYSVSLFSTFILHSAIAQSCPEEELYSGEEASKITRRVKLPTIGIEISVPENYRVMLRNSGEVEILHPQEYALWRCYVEGIRGPESGGSATLIELIPRNPQLSLKEQIEKTFGEYFSPEKFYAYTEGILSGYILVYSDQQTEFIANHPTRKDKLISINDFCDCPIEETDLLKFLSTLAVSTLP